MKYERFSLHLVRIIIYSKPYFLHYIATGGKSQACSRWRAIFNIIAFESFNCLEEVEGDFLLQFLLFGIVFFFAEQLFKESELVFCATKADILF